MAYAVICSLTNLLEQTLNLDFEYLDGEEKQQIASLLEKVSFFQDFLDNSSQKSIKTMEFLDSQMTQIRVAVYRAEHLIESYITDRVHGESASHMGEGSTTLSHKLKEVVEEIDCIKKRVEKFEDQSEVQDQQQQQFSSVPVASSRIAPSGKSALVGFDDDLLEIKTRLVSGSSSRQTISLVGMGGIGKTTVAHKVYDDEFIVHYFDIHAWVTVSQDYNVQEILQSLLECTNYQIAQMHDGSIEELSELLYKSLKGMRYFIVIDDVWDTEFWDKARAECVFPNDNEGSRILLTTRQESVAISANSSSPFHQMHLLNDNDSWKLFCEKVFGEECCPPELKGIGMKIVQHCRGLPLAIVVIGGLLSKLPRTQHDWTSVAENLSSVMTSNDERYSKIMSLSYNSLPHRIKGCFLYMGIFPKDYKINVPKLVKLWIAEGFIKPVSFKTLEDVAEDYLLDLIDRNLAMVFQRSCIGKIKTCRIHDLLRDLCMREAKKATGFHITSVRADKLEYPKLKNPSVAGSSSTSLIQRSIFHFLQPGNIPSDVPSLGLRVLDNVRACQKNMLSMVNMRYLAGYFCGDGSPLSLHKLWNLQTIHLRQSRNFFATFKNIHLPPEIWKMQQLRHVQVKGTLMLPDPPSVEINGKNSVIVLNNLQTLSVVKDFRCMVEVLKRIPNLKKLGIRYKNQPLHWKYYRLKNLALLDKLEALKCIFHQSTISFLKNVKFPTSLKKLTFINGFIPWEDMTIVGRLPHLQALKLKLHSFEGSEWEPNEGEFLQLQFLLLEVIDLKHWRAESSHFPKLQHLVIKSCNLLKEIPIGIGEIDTLRSIELHNCRPSVVMSAKEIKEMQESFGNDDLKVRINSHDDRMALKDQILLKDLNPSMGGLGEDKKKKELLKLKEESYHLLFT